MLDATPCPLCGYDAPERRCSHCNLSPRDPVLTATRSRAWQGFVDGLRAVPMGLWLLARTRGVKRFMVPPLLLTLLSFGLVFYWLWSFFLYSKNNRQITGNGQVNINIHRCITHFIVLEEDTTEKPDRQNSTHQQ